MYNDWIPDSGNTLGEPVVVVAPTMLAGLIPAVTPVVSEMLLIAAAIAIALESA